MSEYRQDMMLTPEEVERLRAARQRIVELASRRPDYTASAPALLLRSQLLKRAA
jgi:hypothetical protein